MALGQFFLLGKNNSERRLRLDAVARHHAVALLKNMERNGLAREKNDAQGKKRDACRGH